MSGYNPAAIEKKWQRIWSEKKVFATDVSDTTKPKFYVLDMFPYPSGQGLHVGHPEGYTATDILARYKRVKGFNVMHPMGWDAFGLPAEQYAIKNNVHPRETTAKNIGRFRAQLESLGFSYDWDREVDTTDPGYYKWTQWIFLQLYDTWFDEGQQRGRAIGELVEEFRSGKRSGQWSVVSGQKRGWDELSAAAQRTVLAGYRLAYEAEVPVNWCQGLGTVLANEEVIDGKSEVGGFPVERRPMRQWMLRITAYSERLLKGLEGLQWSDSLKEMQRNWIGRSEGAEVRFKVAGVVSGQWSELTVFTTRPDTLFGATYMVVAPEHPMVAGITAPEQREKVEAYRKWAAGRSDRERQEDTRKTGEFTGTYAINPVNEKQIPIWVSDYVLMGYGTGAIMAVPGHDERDHAFASKFGLPIVQVVQPPRHQGTKTDEVDIQKEAFAEEGVAVNSAWIEGLATPEAKAKITGILEEKGIGKRQVNYKIRDWLFSRQRYWGEPFPLVHLEDGTVLPVHVDCLPVVLPELEDFRPTGTIDPPLSKATHWTRIWVHIDDDTGSARIAAGPNDFNGRVMRARRELNTMPQWAGSSWYFIRYLDPRNAERFVDPKIEKYWIGDGVDMYVGGVEHAVLHLLYSRFWHKVLFDRGFVSCDEPFRRLVNQGLILGEMEYSVVEEVATGKRLSAVGLPADIERALNDDDGRYRLVKLEETDVEKKGEGFVMKADGSIRVDARSFKMSKSRGNVVNPDDVVRDYGADALRMFEMFMGPLEQVKPWSTAGVEGVYRFMQRVWRNLFDENDLPKTRSAEDETRNDEVVRGLHKLIKKVSDDIERLSFNTALAAMMEFNNMLGKAGVVDQETALTFVRLLEPFAPHFAEEVYERLEKPEARSQKPEVVSVSQLPWPVYDPALLVDATIEVPVQINGKLRSRIMVPNGADEATVFAATFADAEVIKQLAGKEPKKKIYVKGRMVNLVL